MVTLKPPKVLIADSSEEFPAALAAELEPELRCIRCARGDEALDLIRAWQPEVLVLDLSLPGLDGIGLLRQLEVRPLVLAILDVRSIYVQSALEELDVQYAIRKPARADQVADRVRDMLRLTAGAPNVPFAAEVLTRLGLSSGRQGFQHLLTALPELSGHRDQRLSKELYETIARRSNSSAASVEKAIRDTIRAGWRDGDRAVWRQYFPGITSCPANKEFLFRMADVLSGMKRCG